MSRLLIVSLLPLVINWAGTRPAAEIRVPNASFETGAQGPDGWTLTGGAGQVIAPGAAGRRAVSVRGDGKSSNAWLSQPLPLAPNTVYRLRFRARRVSGAGGLPTSGPTFCNRDLFALGSAWTEYESYFVTPRQMEPHDRRLKFGQWEVPGEVAFDDIRLDRVIPVYHTEQGIQLGDGETIQDRHYAFHAPFGQRSANHARPLAGYRASFNSNRWQLSGDSPEIVYRHDVGLSQQTARVTPQIGWYQAGELVVSASSDGRQWRELGTIGGPGAQSFTIPPAMLPAPEIWIRLTARAKPGSPRGAALQVNGYDYQAELDAQPRTIRGATHFVAVTREDPQLDVAFEDVGSAIPGGENSVVMVLRNRTDSRLVVTSQVTLTPPGSPVTEMGPADGGSPAQQITLASATAGPTRVRLPYQLKNAGKHRVQVGIRGDAQFSAEFTVEVPRLYAADYGQTLPGSKGQLGLWWCRSARKVGIDRPVPSERGEALLIRAAANETEAAQLVVRPATPVTQFMVTTGDLRGPGGALIKARNITVSRVGYVHVQQPTDSSASTGFWPDPLPPLRRAVKLPANRNSPFWIRVHVPRATPAGTYQGTLRLTGQGVNASVPLRVEVYGFDLPDRLTCQTAFGLNTSLIWRYHGLANREQKRAVLDKYLQVLSEHHISPYDPAPLDPIHVSWRKLPVWDGGQPDTDTFHGGESCRRLSDTSTTASPSMTYTPAITIPPSGFELRFWYRTQTRDHSFIVTLEHFDAGGKWMSGRNNDLLVKGDGTWQQFSKSVTEFPAGARKVVLRFRSTVWREDGSPTGTVWFDDVSLVDRGAKKELIGGGGFEEAERPAPQPVFDFADWDRQLERAIDHYHFNTFRLGVPGLGGGTFHSRYGPQLFGFAEDTPQYQEAMKSYLGQLQEHLRQKGWLDEAFVYWFDEPSPKDYEFVMNGFRKLKQWSPELRRMLTEQVEPQLVGGPNLWCPVSSSFHADNARARLEAGDSFWWYVCTGPKAPYATLFIDHPATELRVWLWQTWKRQISGILVWSSNYWTSSAAYPDPQHPQNPYQDPMGWVSGYDTPAGTRRAWGNGDGRFLYPPESAASGRPKTPILDAPVPSIRLEMLRDGLEDYEYLAILEQLLKRTKATAAQKKLLLVPPDISSDTTHFTTDPEPIERRRHEIARAIEQLRRASTGSVPAGQ